MVYTILSIHYETNSNISNISNITNSDVSLVSSLC